MRNSYSHFLNPILFHPTTDFDEAFKIKMAVEPCMYGYFRKGDK